MENGLDSFALFKLCSHKNFGASVTAVCPWLWHQLIYIVMYIFISLISIIVTVVPKQNEIPTGKTKQCINFLKS
jgi:hypothetical protein